MYKKLFLLAVASISVAVNAQETNSKRGFYFKAGASYFTQTVATEFPTVSGNAATNETRVNGLLISKESITGSFGEGLRTNLVGGFRFTERLGVEMGVHYYSSNSKTMVERHNYSNIVNVDTYANGKIRAFDISPSLVLFLGEKGKFEPYTKVGVIIPISGNLEIKTDQTSSNNVFVPTYYRRDVIKPNPTLGFMSSIGTTFKISSHLSAYAEVEYRNFTVHGKSKETTDYIVNGQDKLGTLTYSDTHTNYVSALNSSSNNTDTNLAGFDKNQAKDELSSYVGISGIGLTLGVKYSL
ncbi:MAG: outer membrane beta-barrel protein [Limnohabitans sp.]|nr:outer membrane beta-barrel protein [Limnohabitans sp.]